MTTDQGKKGPGRDTESEEKLRGWFTGRLPGDWFTAPADITLDREEITVIGPLQDPETRAEATEAERSGSGRTPVITGSRSPGKPSTSSAARCPGERPAGPAA
jgi:hypothetical protein